MKGKGLKNKFLGGSIMYDRIEKVSDGLYEVVNGSGTTFIYADDKYEAADKYRDMLNEEN